MHAKSCKDEQNLCGEVFFFLLFKPTSRHLRNIAVAIQCNMQLVCCYNCCAFIQEPVFLLEGVFCIIHSSNYAIRCALRCTDIILLLWYCKNHVCVRVCFPAINLACHVLHIALNIILKC